MGRDHAVYVFLRHGRVSHRGQMLIDGGHLRRWIDVSRYRRAVPLAVDLLPVVYQQDGDLYAECARAVWLWLF